jgi:DNA mismatch repair protein MutS2
MQLAERAQSRPARSRLLSLTPSADAAWIATEQKRTAEMRLLLAAGSGFSFTGVIEATEMLAKAAIDGAALDPEEIVALLELAERIEAWRRLLLSPPSSVADKWPAIEALSVPIATHDLGDLLRFLRGKIEADGSLADDASPELRRLRHALARQHRAIEDSLRRALARLGDEGATRDTNITIRGERFVIPVKAEFKRKINGVVHGSSSTGQTVFVEPLETIEENNELVRLLDEEQAEQHRIFVAMTRALAREADALLTGSDVLAILDGHQAVARFAEDFDCIPPTLESPEDTGERVSHSNAKSHREAGWESEASQSILLEAARHPLLELHLRALQGTIVPLTLTLENGQRQLIISGPNTGGKTVALKTTGLLALMAQSGLPLPATRARLPIFTAIYADIGDAQSIENSLSTFSAHITNVERISQLADARTLVLLDELGSATDPEEGAALAAAVAEFFLAQRAWSLITTHLTAMKIYATNREGVQNAAVGFDEATLTPTYDLRLGVPGASAGLNIAARLGLDAQIIASARGRLTTQTADIGRFLDELHAQLDAAKAERHTLREQQQSVDRERLRLEVEGREEQKRRTQELGRKLEELIRGFESEMRDAVKAIDDKAIAQKLQRDSSLRVAQLRREFSEQFQSTVLAHTTRADESDAAPRVAAKPRPGDSVLLKSLGRAAIVLRVLGDSIEVSAGPMKMRARLADVLEVHPQVKPEKPVRRGGITVQLPEDSATEINVIGKTADEAESDVTRFIEHAYLSGVRHVRVVHGVGMGVLRRTLRETLKHHPHVANLTEPPYSEGGQGVTMVEMRP